jgi:hypothetical protein
VLLLVTLEKRRRRTARLEESSELEPSKNTFSWIRVLVWKGERREESFWWEAESGSRSLTSTSMVLVAEKIWERTKEIKGLFCVVFLRFLSNQGRKNGGDTEKMDMRGWEKPSA